MKRHLDLPGLINFRDMGGYKATDLEGETKTVQWERFYRSGHFHDIDPQSQQALIDRRLNTIFDFRAAKEKEKRPNRFAELHTPLVVDLDIDPGSGNSFKRGMDSRPGEKTWQAEDMVKVMESINRSLVKDHSALYKRMFEVLLQDIDGACVIHCASGKDRTGLGSALLLLALGVEYDTVMEDYMLTNQCLNIDHRLKRAVQDFGDQFSQGISPDTLKPIYEVRESYITSAFDEIHQSFENIETYLEKELGLTPVNRRRLQELYLI